MACCLHCGSESITRNGSNRGLQRYRCKDCGRSFNATTETPLSRLRKKELFLAQAECLAQGLSVRATAAKLGVSVSTAFRWRHRFLQEVVSQQPRQLSGLLEADETYFLESQKGSRHLTRPARRRGGKASKRGLSKEQVPVLVGRLRGQPHIADKVLPVMNGVELVKALKQVVSKDTLLCTDGNSLPQGPARARPAREVGRHQLARPCTRQRVSRPIGQQLPPEAQDVDTARATRCIYQIPAELPCLEARAGMV